MTVIPTPTKNLEAIKTEVDLDYCVADHYPDFRVHDGDVRRIIQTSLGFGIYQLSRRAAELKRSILKTYGTELKFIWKYFARFIFYWMEFKPQKDGVWACSGCAPEGKEPCVYQPGAVEDGLVSIHRCPVYENLECHFKRTIRRSNNAEDQRK